MSKNHPDGNNVMSARYKRRHGIEEGSSPKSGIIQVPLSRSWFDKVYKRTKKEQ